MLGMKKDNVESLVISEVEEFEAKLLEIMKAAHKGDERSLEIVSKMKQAIGSL